MEDAKPTYSRAEYSAMSIQDRIRAMNKTLQDDDGLLLASPKSLAVPSKRPTTLRDSSATDETAEMSGEEVTPPKRTSVVDMWRKREGSINRGATTAGRASPVTIPAPRKLQARAGMSPVSGKPASQIVVGLSSPAQGKEGDGNLDNNAGEVYSFDEKKDQALEETEQTSERKEKKDPASSNHTILNPVSSGPVNMTYLRARESSPRSPANSWSKRLVQQAGAALPSPSQHETTPAGENHHQAQYAQDTNIPKRAGVKDIWTKRAGGEGSRPKDMPPLPRTPNAGAKPHLAVDLTPIHQSSQLGAESSPRVAESSPRVAESSPRTSVRDRWLQRENSDCVRQAGDSLEKDEEEVQLALINGGIRDELALINGGISTGGVPTTTTPKSEAAPVTPRTPGGSVADRWTKRFQTSPGTYNSPSSPMIVPSPGAKSDVAGKSSSFWGDVRSQGGKRGSEQDLGKEHPPALTIPSMKKEQERVNTVERRSHLESEQDLGKEHPPALTIPSMKEEQERVNTVGRTTPESAGVPSPRLSMGKLWAKRHSTTESQSNEETGRDNAATDGYGAHAQKHNPASGDSRLLSASPRDGVSKRVLRSPSAQARRDAMAKRNSRAGVATRESSNSESDMGPRDDQLGSTPEPVLSEASINPKVPIISPRSASKKRIETSNVGATPTPPTGALSRKMQFKKLGQKHTARLKPEMDSSEEGQHISEKPERFAPAGISGPASRNGAANNLPSPLSAVNQKRNKRNLQILTNQQGVNTAKASPVAAGNTSDSESAPKTAASQRASPSNAPNRDMKQVLLDKHRQRVNKPGLVPVRSTDDNSVGSESETLSQTFYDIIAEVDQTQLSKQISSAAQRHPQKTGVPAKPSLNVQTLLAFGSQEDKKFDEAADPIIPGGDDVEASRSFDLSYTNSHSPTDASKHAQEMGSDAGASRSSTGANSLAARATRMMRSKHQSKANEERQEHPSDVTETTRRPLVEDQATAKAEHRSQAEPTEIKPTEPNPFEEEDHAHLQPDSEHQTGVSSGYSAYEAQSRFVDSKPSSDSSTVTHTTEHSDAGPSDSVGGNFSFATETDDSNGASLVSEVDSRPDKGERRRTTPRARSDMIAEEFVAESNSNADAFKTAYQSLSLEQIAHDLKEGVTGTITIPGLDFSKLSRDLNEGMSAATGSLSKLVGKKSISPSRKAQLKIPTPKEAFPTEERVAIEVEYVEDSDSE